MRSGVVYARYRLHAHANWGIIFQSGRHDDFNACEVNWFLSVTSGVCEALQEYTFENAKCLTEDFERGVFAPAFRMARGCLI